MNITLKAAAAFLAAALAASCVFEKENPADVQQRYRHALVQIGVNTDNMTQTRTEGDVVNKGEQDGTAVETAIKSLRVYAYTQASDGTKTLCGYVSANDVTSASTLVMDIMVPFSQTGTTQKVFFMAVANEAGMTGTSGIIINEIGRNPVDGSLVLPSNFSWGSFAGIVYSVNDQTFSNGMPMYCQTTTTVDVNLESTTTPITTVTLDLTRSLSKIEVYAAEDAAEGTSGTSNAGLQITGVELINVIKEGPLFPGTASATAITPNPSMALNLAEGQTVVPVTASVSATDKTDTTKYTRATNAYYLAENAAGTADKFSYGNTYAEAATTDNLKKATALKIGYRVGTSGDQKFGYVVMPPIVRNNWYKVLARIKANGKLSLTLNVVDWQTGEVGDPVNFEDLLTFDEGYGLKWNGVNIEGNVYSMPVAANSTVECKFKISAPVGGKWYATLSGGDVQNYQIVGGTGDIGDSESSFTIKTLNSNLNSGSDRAVQLKIIAVSNSGRSMVVNFNTQGYYTVKQNQM